MPDLMPDGSSWPRVSIVTASYNQASFVEETIRTVLLQGYPDLEYIVFDGASTDGTLDILHKYDPWLAHWVSEPDKGQANALNNGFRLTTGVFVGWLNADDTLCPGAIVQAVRELSANANAGLIYSDCNWIDAESRLIGSVPSHVFRLEDVLRTGLINTPAVLWSRNIFDQVGYLDETLHYVLDSEFWMRACTAARPVYSRFTLGNYRRHTDSKTFSREAYFHEELAEITRHFIDAEPYRTAVLATTRRRIMGQAAWFGGVALCQIGQDERAHPWLREAILDHAVLDDFLVASTPVLFQIFQATLWPAPKMRETLAALNNLLCDLPPRQRQQFAAFCHAVEREHAKLAFFEAHKSGLRQEILSTAWPAWRANPRLGFNRGFWSIWLRNLARGSGLTPPVEPPNDHVVAPK